MVTNRVTYGQLYRLLTQLEFVHESSEPRWRVYRHGSSDVLIVLANRESKLPASSVDLVSVRRHLEDNGILDQCEFERLLS